VGGKSNSQNKDFQLWQQNNHPVPLTTMAMAHQKPDYIHNNPVEAGIVEKTRRLFVQQRKKLLRNAGFD